MTRIVLIIALFAQLFCADDQVNIPVTPFKIDGIWTGYYSYQENKLRPVAIAVVIMKEADGKIIGDVLEPNTFGPTAAPALTSKISGMMADKIVKIMFKYDGREGVSHSVENTFKFSDDGKSLIGTWLIGKDWHGKIYLTKTMDAHRENPVK